MYYNTTRKNVRFCLGEIKNLFGNGIIDKQNPPCYARGILFNTICNDPCPCRFVTQTKSFG